MPAALAAALRRGIDAFSRGELDAAEAAFSQVVAGRPDQPVAQQLLGVIAHSRGDSARAIALIRQAIAADPGYVEAHHNLGRVLLQTGRLDDAAEALGQAVALNPDYREAQLELANVLRAQGRLRDALEICERLIADDAGYAEALLNAANLKLEMGRLRAAGERYDQAIAARPDFAPAYDGLGNLLKRQGLAVPAAEAYAKAAELAPDDEEFRVNLREARAQLIPPWHFTMLGDEGRNDAFQRAIEAAVARRGPDALVLDIGTGSGLLAMMAARAGAKRVIACEAVEPLAAVAREIVADNGFADAITVIARRSSDLEVGPDLPAPADIVIAEILDNALLGEGIVPSLKHALANLAAPDATVIPAGAEVFAMLVECPHGRRVNPVGPISGFDLGRFDGFRNPEAIRRFDLAADPHRLLSAPAAIGRFDFHDPPGTGARALRIETTGDGAIQAVVYWFRLDLDGETTLSTGADNPHGHWRQAIQYLDADLPVVAGQTVELSVRHGETNFRFGLAPVG